MKRLSHWLALTTLTTLSAGCSDQGGPTVPPVTPRVVEEAISCQVTVATRHLTCEPAQLSASGGMMLNVNLGGTNGSYVQLTSSGSAYNGTVFTSSVTVQNKTAQAMATADGTTPDANGVRVWFNNNPTVTSGSGTVAVVPDGMANFTGSGQAYYLYPGVLATGAVSTGKTWTFTVSNTVTRFDFTVLVNARIPDEAGVLHWTPQTVGTVPFDEIAEACGEAWAVGGSSAITGPPPVAAVGSIQHYKNGTWTAQTDPVAENLHSVEMTCNNGTATGVAVGDNGTILYYDGTNWTDHHVGGGTLMSVSQAGTEWWACGLGGQIVHSADGLSWLPQTSNAPTGTDFFVCGGPAANSVYAAGTAGYITHYNGTTWSATGYTSGTTQAIRSATGSGTGGIWLVGDNGAITYGADGMTFVPQTSGTTQALYGAENASGTGVNLYVSGANGTILNYNGTAWTTQATGTTTILNDVAIITNGTTFTEAWAVGNSGLILHGTH